MVGLTESVRVGKTPPADNLIEAQFESTRRLRFVTDKLAVYVLLFCALLTLVPLFSILFELMRQGLTALNWDFFTKLPKPVGEPGGGMANAIGGTIVILGIALAVGFPIGLGTGIYLSEFAGSRYANTIRFLVDVMNGIPSIVYGIFAYTMFVLPMGGFSALSGGGALGIMMIPIITRTTEQFLRMVPQNLREAGLALGAPQWRVILDIVLASAMGGIVTGVMVALARVAGETAPLLFTAFGNRYWATNLHQPIAALSLQIYSYAISPFDDWHRQAWAGALVLIAMIFLINLISSYFVSRRARMLGKN